MGTDSTTVMLSGFAHLFVSQVATRLITFMLTLLTARMLTIEGYGLAAVQFHLINTVILLLSREGFRRGCLRADENEKHFKGATQRLLATVALSLPLGLLVTAVTCAAALWHDRNPDHRSAILLQGLAAMVELAAEPLYVLSQVQLRFKLRVSIDAVAHTAKAALTLLLLRFHMVGEVTAICLAQLAFAASILLGYGAAYAAEAFAWLGMDGHIPEQARQEADRRVQGLIDWQALPLCSSFTLQAGEKLILAEGSKFVMVLCQSSYNQGVYGLVVNLGSLVVRTLFQPFEEAAFLAFGRPVSKTDGVAPSQQRLRILSVTSKGACVIGGVAAAFGPAYAYLALRLAYGQRWSETGAPAALALYSSYVGLLAVNGILEAFQHAVATPAQLVHSNAWLIGCAVTHFALSMSLVGWLGTNGLILADAGNMVLRIGYSLWFVRHHCSRAGLQGHSLSALFPNLTVMIALMAAFVVTSASNAVLLGGPGQLREGCKAPCPQHSFWLHACAHIGVGMAVLMGVAAIIFKTERHILHGLRQAQRQAQTKQD